MSEQTIIFLLSGIAFILAVVNCILFYYFFKVNKKMDEIIEGGRIKDFKNLFLKYKEKDCELDKKIKEAFLKIKELQDISKKTFQKIGVVRFNPFNGMGGNQSFVIAMLDDENNGFVLSSIFIKEGNRVYAKTIKNGKSDHLLSNEENEAISKAIN